MAFVKLNDAYFEDNGNGLQAVADPSTELQAVTAPAVAGDATRFARSLPSQAQTAQAAKSLPQTAQTPSGGLTGFAAALNEAVAAARRVRQSQELDFLGGKIQPGSVSAGTFTSLLGDLNTASSNFSTPLVNSALETAQAQQAALEKQKSDIRDLALTVASNGGSQDTINAILAAQDVDSAISIASGSLQEKDKGQLVTRGDGSVVRITADNEVIPVLGADPSKDGPNGKPPTQAQSQAAGFAARISEADVIIQEIGDQFTGVGSTFGQFLPNQFQSPDRQRFEQAKRNYINAVLRRESGAAISPSEFASAERQYFPQPGDSPAVVIQKQQNRNTVLSALRSEAGPALSNPLDIGSDPNDPLDIF